MLAVYLPETGVSRHSRPFLILTDEFKPQPAASEGGRDRGEEREKRKKGGRWWGMRKKQMAIGKED